MKRSVPRFAPLAVRCSPIPAHRPLTPAARLLIERGIIFDVDGDHYTVDQRFDARTGVQADVIVLHGVESMHGPVQTVRRAIQVRDLERLIDEDRVHIVFGPSARQYNRRVQARWRRQLRGGGRRPASHRRGAAR